MPIDWTMPGLVRIPVRLVSVQTLMVSWSAGLVVSLNVSPVFPVQTIGTLCCGSPLALSDLVPFGEVWELSVVACVWQGFVLAVATAGFVLGPLLVVVTAGGTDGGERERVGKQFEHNPREKSPGLMLYTQAYILCSKLCVRCPWLQGLV